MKRHINDIYENYISSPISSNTRSKKRKLLKPLDDKNDNIYATSLHNYFLKDPIVDWIKRYNSFFLKDNNKNSQSFTRLNYRFQQGIIFEQNMVEIIKKSTNYLESTNIERFSEEGYKNTLKMMKNGVKIIHSAHLKNPKLGYYGVADLIVRSDVFNKKFKKLQKIKHNYFLHKFYYIVIDIKNKKFYVDNDFLLKDTNELSAYKAQLFIYNSCLEYMQNYFPQKAYFIGKSYHNKTKSFTSLQYNCLPTVDFKDKDKSVISQAKKAVDWVRKVNNFGVCWSLNPPSLVELYPNMKCSFNDDFYHLKLQIAERIGEITLIIYCGVKNRQFAFDKGVFSWKDKKLNANLLGFKNNSKKTKIIDNIIKVNRDNIPILYNKTCLYDEKKTLNITNSGFVDIETYNNKIYLIGISYYDNKEWKYKSFFLKKLKNKSEKENLQNFINFLTLKKINKIFHHSSFDKREIFKKINYYSISSSHLDKVTWVDTWKFFYKIELAIKGMFNYKLKNIWKAMKAGNMITTDYDGECKNGSDSLSLAYELYENAEESNHNILESYNKFDCTVLKDIIIFFRDKL